MKTFTTPDDEIKRPGYFYPPFTAGWLYEGVTYGGHTDFATDWNRRRIVNGKVVWVQDAGDPVLAQADGTVVSIDPTDGTAVISHFGGTYRTESVHMDPILVKPKQKVKRGQIIGKIGKKGISPSSGFVPSEHLHVVHWQRVDGEWKRIKQSYLGKKVEASVWNSDALPRGTDMPGPTYVTGAPEPVTWEDAYREAVAAYMKAEARNTVLGEKLEECGAKLVAAEARIAALEAGVDQVALGEALEHARSVVSILEPMTDGGGS